MALTRSDLVPRTVQYLMFVYNLFFVITGIVLLSIGFVIYGAFCQYPRFLDNRFFVVPSLLVAVGIIIFIIAFFGCCGAMRESYCMITTFSTLLILIFILEIVAGTMGYLMRADVATLAQRNMLETMSAYNTSKNIQFMWDDLQQDFKCCGTFNATDWTRQNNTLGIPVSCCDRVIGAVGVTNCTLESPNLHHQGCMDAFVDFAEKHASKIAGVGIGLGIVQLIGISLSCYLAKSIRNSYEPM